MENKESKSVREFEHKPSIIKGNIHPPKDTILVSGDIGRPDLEMSPEKFYEFQKKKEKHRNDFIRILIKSPFEEYTEKIYQELLQIKYGNVEFVEESRRIKALAYFREKKEIATALLVCKTDTDGIGINNAKQRCKLSPFLKKKIEAVLEAEYEDSGLDYTPMTYEEGKERLENNLCEDVRGFIEDYWEEYAQENGLNAEERSGGYSYDDIDDDMIEYFISGSKMKREITIDQIRETIAKLEEGVRANQRKGAPRINEKPYSALLVFIKYRCRKTHKHLKYAYDCLDHFDLIDNSTKSGWDETDKYPKIQYIKRLFDECINYRLVVDPLLPF